MATIDALVSQFRAAAIEKGDGVTPAERDRMLHLRMKEALVALREAGDVGEAAFRSLLSDGSFHVRSWVAAELLSQGDLTARAVLEELARESGTLGFDARMALKEHVAGRLRSPFP